MIDLIKVAEKQIEKLEEVQGSKAINTIEVSEEIRKWCEFIKSLDKDETDQEGQVQEQSINIMIDGGLIAKIMIFV